MKEWKDIIEQRKIELEAEELGLKSKAAEPEEVVDPLKAKRAQKREQARKRLVKGKEIEHMTRLDFQQQKPLEQ